MKKFAHPSCVLWGGYACGNTGDELTLAAALQDARARFGEAVAVLSPNADYTQWLFPGARVIAYEPRSPPLLCQRLRRAYERLQARGLFRHCKVRAYRLRDQAGSRGEAAPPWVEAIVHAQQLYLVGGGYLSELFNLDHLLLPLKVANAAAVPVATAPLGLGPFSSNQAATWVAQALGEADLVVRDRASLEFCAARGLRAKLQPDDGFRVAELLPGLVPPASTRQACTAGAGRYLRVGVCVSDQPGSTAVAASQAWWVRFLRALKRYEAELVIEGFCFHSSLSCDFATLVRLFHVVGLGVQQVQAPLLDFRLAVRNLCRYDVIVSTRFHAIVVASVLGIPHVAFASGEYYRRKMAAAVQPCQGTGRLVTPEGSCPEEVADHVSAACRQSCPLAE
jgi:polysaccharide pyruvyl transferase WcaK-like protein